MVRALPASPLVAIVGATGTGKSQLAVELATRFNGEVINGDAMQLYDGLPIITNKIRLGEQKDIPHHLMGCVKLEEEPWTVDVYGSKALKVIQDIQSRGRLPILVGGTHYYIQSLLFPDAHSLRSSSEGESERPGSLTQEEISRRYPILDASSEEIWDRLNEVDPVMANRWHPKDRRKLQRSLEIYLLTGRRASDIYEEQQEGLAKMGTLEDRSSMNRCQKTDDNMKDPSSPPRSTRASTLVLWIHVSPEVLRPRLDARVHAMVENGLLSEVDSLDQYLRRLKERGSTVDQTRGIWVSIGFKEFDRFSAALRSGTCTDHELEEMKQDAISRTQAATRQYAKRQVRWIRIKLLQATAATGLADQTFVLDGDDVQQWSQDIVKPAVDLVERFLGGDELPLPASHSPTVADLLLPRRGYDLSDRRDLWVRRTCETCGTTTITDEDWNRHAKGRAHKKAQKRRARVGRGSGLSEDVGVVPLVDV